MELNLSFNLNFDKEKRAEESVKNNLKKQTKAKYEPTWDEVWSTGYTTHTGTVKRGILQSKLTDLDRQRLLEVKQAIEVGELSSHTDSMSKFTKARALSLHKELKELRREQIIAQMIENKPSNYFLITTEEQFNWVLEQLNNESIIALDTETTGVEMWGSDVVVGLSMTLPRSDIHVYIPVRHCVEDEQLPASAVFEELKPYLEDVELKKVLHNAKFDVHMLRKEGIEVKGIEMDTMIAAHCLNENEPSYALKNLATKYGKYFGFEDKSMTYEELFGKGGFEGTPLLIGSIYACKDTHLTYQYYQWILTQMERVPQLKTLYFGIENKVLEVSIEMEKNGFLIDLDYAKKYQAELTAEIEALNKKIREGFGDINVNSIQQLSNTVYNIWGIKDEFKGKVDASTLKTIVTKYKDSNENVHYIEALLNYRELNKLLTTYIEPLPTKISEVDGRLHGSFNQSATKTGRFASNNPNLQNIPYPARPMFVAPEGKLIIGIDYSQIEPRILAHISNDTAFKEAYIQNRDLYSEIASRTFDVPIEQCGDGSKYRKQAKVILLG